MAAKPAVYTYRLCQVGRHLLKKQNPPPTPQWKIDYGKEIVNVFENNNKILIFHFNALNAEEWTNFRFDMCKENMAVKVYRNSIVSDVLTETKYANICSLFKSDTAIAFSSEEVNLKSILKLFRVAPKIELIGAVIDNTIMNTQNVTEYSKLPTLDESRAELIQILSQPGSSLSKLLLTNQSNLSRSLSLYIDQDSSTE